VAEFHEAIIIGGGPAGLTAGIYLVRGGIDTLLLERIVPGGTPVNTDRVENYPGFPEGISGRALMERFTSHAQSCGLAIKEFAEVVEVSYTGNTFLITTTSHQFESIGLIIATGTEPAKMNIPGEREFVGMGISYCATCDGAFFKNMDVAVIGGGDAAIEESLSLAKIVKKVYVVHRRDRLRAQKILQERAFRNDKIMFLWNKKPIEIGGTGQVEYLIVEDTLTGERTTVHVSGVFVYVGSRPNTSFLGNLVERDEAGFIVTDGNLCTKTKGLFVAGDARKKTLRQIATAVGDGALAAVNLERYIVEER